MEIILGYDGGLSMALPLQGKGPCLKQPLLALILLSLLSLLNQSAATVLVSPLAFVNPQIQLPRLERALLSGTVTSAASPTSARLLQSTHPRMPGRSQRGEAIGLRALVESGPALPPSHTAFTAPLLPTALRSGADVCSHLLHFERKIFLWGSLTDEAAASITAQLLMLYAESNESTGSSRGGRRSPRHNAVEDATVPEGREKGGERPSVELIINCRGGSLTAGLALYDILSLVSTTLSIRTLAVGSAGHLGALFLAAGKRGERRATRNTRIFLCESAAHAQGSAEELLHQAASLASQEQALEKLLAKHTGRPTNQVYEWRKHSQVFTTEEATRMGIIDAIVKDGFDEVP